MHLTNEEECMLNGEYGWANQVSMKILTRLGDLFGASRLIPIQSAHLSGVSYKHLGDAAIDFLGELADNNGVVTVPTTLNPASIDPDYLTKHYSQERLKRQSDIINVYMRMGANPVLTCTPYYLRRPMKDQHLAWAESSAVIYANSVLGAWTNREGSPSALAAALIGKTPDYGMHQKANRQPQVEIKMETTLNNEAEYGALGVHLGKILKDRIPMFNDLQMASQSDLKHLGAGMASSGMTAMLYNRPIRETGKLEEISIERKDIEEAFVSLCGTTEAPDLVFVGCPHCSSEEIRNTAGIIEGRRVRRDTELWICTSRHVKEQVKEHVDLIEQAGGHVLCDTCAVVTWIRDLKMNVVVTNSAKTAHYAPTLNQVEASLEPLNRCIDIACKS